MQFLRNLFTLLSSLIFALTPQNSYVEGLVGQPVSFLPNEVRTENDKTISKLLFRGLFKYDNDGSLVTDLADSYEVSEDGLAYTVFLKKNQKWTNGEEITADDLLYSAFSSENLKEIATDKIDRYTIRYTLPNKFSPFQNILTAGVTPSIQKNNKMKPVSSGPYEVVRIKREGPIIREVVLGGFAKELKVSKVSFRYYENEDQLVTAAKLGEVDGFMSTAKFDWPSFNEVLSYQRGIYFSLIFNLREEKLNDLEVRKKLFRRTPLADIAKIGGLPATGPISESPYTKDLDYNVFEPELSDELNLDLDLIVPGEEEFLEIGKLISDNWRPLGVNVNVKRVSPDEIEQTIIPTRDFDVLLYGQEVSRDPDRYALWHSTRVDHPGLNLSGFENVRLDRSLEEGRNSLSEEARIKDYNIFQDVMYENVPAIFLYHPTLRHYVSKRVKTVHPENIFYAHERFKEIASWTVD